MKRWWKGDPRVELFMEPVREALKRNNIEGEAKVDIYNRCYEAVYHAITTKNENVIKEVANRIIDSQNNRK